MISNFLKKITIYNAALLIIFLRIYGPLNDYIEENSGKNSIFPKSDENGYPFQEALKYNIDDIKRITTILKTDNKKIKNENKFIPILPFTSNKCSFFKIIEICQDNKECFQEMIKIKEGSFLYHKIQEYNKTYSLNNEKIINLIQYKNQFLNENKTMMEIPLYYQIIDGYSSYLLILSDDINLIKEVTQNELKMNNLLFFYILYLKCYINNNNNSRIYKFFEMQEDNLNNIISSLSHAKKEELMNIINKILPENIINCIPDLDTRFSFFIDFQSINEMLQILFNRAKKNHNLDKFNFLFQKLSNAINKIFVLDEKIKVRGDIFLQIKKYMVYIYWSIAFLIIFFCNKYFIKHKEFYTSKTRTIKNVNRNMEYKKYLKYQENLIKIQKNNRNKYTPEEIEMINKLTKDQKDYIISK